MSLPTVTIGKRTFTILFPDLLRALTDSERQALKNSIKTNGVEVAIVVDEDDGIIDGGNRAQIAAELGLHNVRTDVRKGLSVEQKIDLAHTLNDARRHLSGKDRKQTRSHAEQRKLTEQALKANPEKSNRQIAEEVGTHHSTVQPIREKLEAGGEISHLEKRIDKVGKEQPASRSSKSKSGSTSDSPAPSSLGSSGADDSAPEDASPVIIPPVPTDVIGLPIPDKLRSVFAARALFADARKLHKELTAKLNEIALLDEVSAGNLRKDLSRRERDGKPYFRSTELESVKMLLDDWEPHVACCPWCLRENDGNPQRDCKACHGKNWIPHRLWRQASREDRERVERQVQA